MIFLCKICISFIFTIPVGSCLCAFVWRIIFLNIHQMILPSVSSINLCIVHFIAAEVVKAVGKVCAEHDEDGAHPQTDETAATSPPRKRRTLFASYEKHISKEVKNLRTVANPSSAATVMLYVDNLPTLAAQARVAEKPWDLFKQDMRFVMLHKLQEKVLCVPATSAPVERVFSHGGIFMRPHRARLGARILSNLVFAKCNKHLK